MPSFNQFEQHYSTLLNEYSVHLNRYAGNVVVVSIPESAGSADGDGWTAVDGNGPRLAEWELPDLDLLAELTHPIRSRVLRSLDQPRTVTDVATLLDMPVTRLYHHVNRLESLGLISVVATRRVGAVTERRYQTVAASFRVAKRLRESSDPRELSLALGALFDVAKMSFQRDVERRESSDPLDPSESLLSLVDMKLSPDGRAQLMERLRVLVDEYGTRDDPDDDAITVSLFIAAGPDSV